MDRSDVQSYIEPNVRVKFLRHLRPPLETGDITTCNGSVTLTRPNTSLAVYGRDEARPLAFRGFGSTTFVPAVIDQPHFPPEDWDLFAFAGIEKGVHVWRQESDLPV